MSNLNKYERMSNAELKKLFIHSECSDLKEMHGAASGKVLFPIWFKKLNLWKGKVFHFSEQHGLTGLNRIGMPYFEILKYSFEGHIAKSLFFDKQVIVIDHNSPKNPSWVRRYHDELVKVEDQVFLGMSYYKQKAGLKFVSYFILDFSKI
ncbi:hypothetical protein [Acinetobacter sp. MB5]|uniref:hypothetical protein n=1 Tax=Acinetobacter sp. MB5 TaxID=2069438 RepID=UPI000DD0A24A|nr:hypothetical protein [Acinetobacter sp. MB5]